MPKCYQAVCGENFGEGAFGVLDWKGIKSEDKPNLLAALETAGLPFKKV